MAISASSTDAADGRPGRAKPAAKARGALVQVTGVVQGVGFRPFVHRLATELALTGHVGNDANGVFIQVNGPAPTIEQFVERLSADAPPLASVATVSRSATAVLPATGFSIVASRTGGGAALVPPDAAVCVDCLRELFDPTDRRHGHPFITCTNCGPRFTIIRSVPFDRPNTTMAGFTMCARCAAEYADPDDRRHHAQPIACRDCGPTLSFVGDADRCDGDHALRAAVSALDAGSVVAVKGLGGYHLAVDAAADPVVAELRHRKRRADKPFAVMVSDLEQARSLASVSSAEAELLASPAAPIVLLRARAGNGLSPLVAPGNPLIGVMLPYSPVHHLLFHERPAPLVMTSANLGGQPMAHRYQDLARSNRLHDVLLDHDRPIHVPCDDSVVRVVDGRPLPIRRGRGHAPLPLAVPAARRSVLAVGAELKNTCCVVADGQAWVSQHIGDMENLETLEAFEATANDLAAMHGVTPAVVVADAHPGHLSSRWARRRHGDRLLEVQHHHAHIAAVMAEHGLDPHRRVLGFAFDGTGHGDDGTIWGGEVLSVDADGYDRLAHLAPVPLPGGDAAIANPCRVALAHLHAAGLCWDETLAPVAALDATERALLRRQLERGVATVPCTSMGRLFDAVASLLGCRQTITYEAQAAIELEILAEDGRDEGCSYRFWLSGEVIDPGPVLAAVVADLDRGAERRDVALAFHRAIADVIARLAERHGDGAPVALSGGVFQNALLTRLTVAALGAAGIGALTHSIVPPNDGGLALGQAWVAAHADLSARRPEPTSDPQESI